jgi:trehalose 6-phosphate synthase
MQPQQSLACFVRHRLLTGDPVAFSVWALPIPIPLGLSGAVGQVGLRDCVSKASNPESCVASFPGAQEEHVMGRILKLVLPLAISVGCVSLLYTLGEMRVERQNLRNELERRSAVIAETLAERIESWPEAVTSRNLGHLLDRYAPQEHLIGIAFYDTSGIVLAITPGLTSQQLPQAERAVRTNRTIVETTGSLNAPRQLYVLPVHRNDKTIGSVVVVSDARFIQEHLWRTLRASLLTISTQIMLVSALAIILLRWNFLAPLTSTAHRLRSLRSGLPNGTQPLPKGEIFEQIHTEVRHLAQDLNSARVAAQEEAQLRESQSMLWTPDRLRVSLQNKLEENSLFVVSNREPYVHVHGSRDNSIQVIIPASGVVTALEPVLEACHGTWVANGTGNADKEVVDELDRLGVPPSRPSYVLRRIWLTEEEDRGYYEGFSNEGLWPLCHIAHTRPLFRPEDWQEYERVNRRFANAVVQDNDRRGRTGCPSPGLPPGAAAAHGQGSAAGRARGDLLAHPLAEPGGVSDLPVAGGTVGRPARR